MLMPSHLCLRLLHRKQAFAARFRFAARSLSGTVPPSLPNTKEGETWMLPSWSDGTGGDPVPGGPPRGWYPPDWIVGGETEPLISAVDTGDVWPLFRGLYVQIQSMSDSSVVCIGATGCALTQKGFL